MTIKFISENQEKVFLDYMPRGRIYKQARIPGSLFNKIIKWITLQFEVLLKQYNETIEGLFVCVSLKFLPNYQTDYNMPNEIFYINQTDSDVDVFVSKYLLRGNTEWYFRAIANAYGVDVIVRSNKEAFRNTPPQGTGGTVYITIVDFNAGVLPYDLPFPLGLGRKRDKIKALYEIIKSAETRLVYQEPYETEGLDVEASDQVLRDLLPERIQFCINNGV